MLEGEGRGFMLELVFPKDLEKISVIREER